MKKIISITFFILCIYNSNAQSAPSPVVDIAKVLSFTNDNYNMGNIAYGKPTEFAIDVQNISSAPIVLENVMVGCGCTTPKFTKGFSILPGAHTSLILGFNGSAIGNFSKSATIFFSGGLTKTVTFFGVGVQ